METLIHHGIALPLTLLAGVMAPFFLIRVVPRALVWAAFSVMVNLAWAAAAIRLFGPQMDSFELVGYFTSGAALFWSIVVVALRIVALESDRDKVDDSHAACFLSAAILSAMTAVCVAAVIVVIMVSWRAATAIVEMRLGAPLMSTVVMPEGATGLGMIGLLLAACVLSYFGTRDVRLVSPMYWLFVVGGVWFSLMEPMFRPTPGGAFTRTAFAGVCMLCLSAVTCGFVYLQANRRSVARWAAARQAPDCLLQPAMAWPGFHESVKTVGAVLILLICYQWAVPPTPEFVSGRVLAIVISACAIATGAAMFLQLTIEFSRGMADVAMGLTSLGFASLFLLFVPNEPAELGSRYPSIFTALMFGLTLTTAYWSWTGAVWHQQLDEGRAWTVAGHLSMLAPRFSFLVGCFALVMGSLTAIWPRLRPIGETDATLGRISACVAAHLLLILVLIRNRRRTRRTSFGALAALVMLSLIAFVAVRVWPMTSTVIPAGS